MPLKAHSRCEALCSRLHTLAGMHALLSTLAKGTACAANVCMQRVSCTRRAWNCQRLGVPDDIVCSCVHHRGFHPQAIKSMELLAELGEPLRGMSVRTGLCIAGTSSSTPESHGMSGTSMCAQPRPAHWLPLHMQLKM